MTYGESGKNQRNGMRTSTRGAEQEYIRELERRKIRLREGKDILRWGKAMKGTFTVKEAYYWASKEEREMGALEWKKIWEAKWWPKITLFAWLVGKGRILTWDNIQKRGMNGPSRCSLCRKENETQEHLLNKCLYAQSLWEEIRMIFGKTKRDPDNIRNTLMQWGKGEFQSRIVRRIWNLAVGFVIWALWRERNHRIFREKSSQESRTWEEICKGIKETILSESWDDDDWKLNPEEQRIVSRLNINASMAYPNTERRIKQVIQSPKQFRLPGDQKDQLASLLLIFSKVPCQFLILLGFESS